MPGEIDARRSGGVHVFSTKDRDLAYDAETGSLHTLDPAGRAVLQWVIDRGPQVLDEGPIPQEVFRQIPRGLSREQIEEAWSELVSLRGKTLFGVADGRETGGYCENHEANPGTQWVKALCLNVAHDCNLACKYCFAGLGRFGGRPQIMTPEVAEKALDFVLKASSPGASSMLTFRWRTAHGLPTVKFLSRPLERKGLTRQRLPLPLTTNCVLYWIERPSDS